MKKGEDFKAKDTLVIPITNQELVLGLEFPVECDRAPLVRDGVDVAELILVQSRLSLVCADNRILMRLILTTVILPLGSGETAEAEKHCDEGFDELLRSKKTHNEL
jgi:hypothetical protein